MSFFYCDTLFPFLVFSFPACGYIFFRSRCSRQLLHVSAVPFLFPVLPVPTDPLAVKVRQTPRFLCGSKLPKSGSSVVSFLRRCSREILPPFSFSWSFQGFLFSFEFFLKLLVSLSFTTAPSLLPPSRTPYFNFTNCMGLSVLEHPRTPLVFSGTVTDVVAFVFPCVSFFFPATD